jgi:hypothetical protein
VSQRINAGVSGQANWFGQGQFVVDDGQDRQIGKAGTKHFFVIGFIGNDGEPSGLEPVPAVVGMATTGNPGAFS